LSLVFRVRTLVRPSYDGQTKTGEGIVVANDGDLSRHQLHIKKG
jgi:hypothetical protein